MPIKYDNEFVKRPREEVEYTPEMIKELERCKESVLHFIKYFKIVHPDKGEITFDPYDFQFDLIKKFKKHRFNIALCSRQSGKALALDTPIPMPNGRWTTMGNIEVGDIILNKNGLPTSVTFVTENMYNHNCYEIEFDNGEKIIADEDHLWEVNSSNFCKRNGKNIIRNQSKVLTTKEILEKKIQFDSYKKPANIYIEYNEGIKNKKVKLPVDPYILGVWIGDGNSSDSRITTNIEDYENLKKEITKRGFRVSEFRPDKRNDNTGNFNIYKNCAALRKENLLKNKHIPKVYFSSSIEQRLELIRGLMDTDGYCKNKNGACEFFQKKYEIILQFRELLSSLGIKSRIRSKEVKNETYYTVSFSTSDYFVFNLKRKRVNQSYCNGHPKNKRIYIKNITKVNSVPVRCIQVDDDESLFLCGKTMIPTHNTTVVAAYVLWYAIFHDDKQVGLVSNKESSAKMILSRIKRAYEQLPVWLKPGVTEYSKTFIAFDNGTKINVAATSADAFRGDTMNILVCDEFAFVPGHQAEEFWAANYPTISASKQSKIIIISTPNGLFNIYHRLYVGAELGKNTFVSTKVTWREVPGRDDEWAEEQRRNLGDRQFNQEFAVEFIGSVNTVIKPEVLEVILKQSESPILKDLDFRLSIWEKPKKECKYVLGVDPAAGTGDNYSAIQVLRIDSLKPIKLQQVAVFHHNTTDVYEFADIVNRLCYFYNGAYIMCENNGEGSAVVKRIWWEHENENLVNSGAKESNIGIRATGGRGGGTKSKAVLLMKKLIEDGSLRLVDDKTLKELGSFIESNGKYEGKDMNDDLVSALYWAVYLFEMNILDESYTFRQDKEDEKVWGVLTDVESSIEEDWSWLIDGSFTD